MPHLPMPRAGMQFLEEKKSDKGREVRTEIVKEKKSTERQEMERLCQRMIKSRRKAHLGRLKQHRARRAERRGVLGNMLMLQLRFD